MQNANNLVNNELSEDEDLIMENDIENNNKSTPKIYRCKHCSKILLNYLDIENHNFEIFSFCSYCNQKWKNNFNSFDSYLYALDSAKCWKCKKETRREKDKYYYCYDCKNFFCVSCKRKHNNNLIQLVINISILILDIVKNLILIFVLNVKWKMIIIIK